MENIISSLLNIKELMEDNLRRFDVVEKHLKEWRESHNKMHQVFQQSIEDFTTNIQESFNEFEAQICEIQEEDVVAVEEKDEIKPAQLFLSYVPKNLEPFLPFSDPSLRISCSFLHVRKYFFSSSFLSVAISNRDPLIKRNLTIICEFDPGGVDHGLQDLDGFLFCFSCDGERMNSLSFPFHPERTVTHQIYSTMASTTTLYSTTQPVVMHLMLRDSTTTICGPFSPLQPICTISLSLIGLATQKKKSLYYHISKPYDILAAEEALNQSSPPGLEDEKLVHCKISWLHLWGHFSLCYNGQKLVTETDSIRNYGLKDGEQLKFVRHIAIGYNLRKRRAKKRVAWELRGKKYVAPLVLDVLLLRGVFEPFDRGRGRFDILLGFICSRTSQLTLDMKGGLSHSGSHLASTYNALAILKMDGDVRYESSNNSIEKQLIENDGQWLHELALNKMVLEALNFYMTDLVKIQVYSTSMTMLLTMVLHVYLFNFKPTLQFCLGIIICMMSLHMYFAPPYSFVIKACGQCLRVGGGRTMQSITIRNTFVRIYATFTIIELASWVFDKMIVLLLVDIQVGANPKLCFAQFSEDYIFTSMLSAKQVVPILREAAKECKIILDVVESALPTGMSEGIGEDCKLQEMFHKALELLPVLWTRAAFLDEAIIAYRWALIKPWNLDPQRLAGVQKDLAATLLYGGIEANIPPQLKVRDPTILKNDTEEAILLLLILMRKVALREIKWDIEIIDHLTYAFSIPSQFELLADHVEQDLPGIYNRTERWYFLALCYSAAGHGGEDGNFDWITDDELEVIISSYKGSMADRPHLMDKVLLWGMVCHSPSMKDMGYGPWANLIPFTILDSTCIWTSR